MKLISNAWLNKTDQTKWWLQMQLKFISHEGKNCALRETNLRYKKFE